MPAGGTQRPSHNPTPGRQPRDPIGAIEGTCRRPHGCPPSNPQSAPLVTDGLLWPRPQARGHTVIIRSHGHTPLHEGTHFPTHPRSCSCTQTPHPCVPTTPSTHPHGLHTCANTPQSHLQKHDSHQEPETIPTHRYIAALTFMPSRCQTDITGS